MSYEQILSIVIIAPVILLAITVHEFAHGYAAYRLGDPTPKAAGRLTLNPISHLDLMGTLLLFIAHFGWAKPVPINPMNFRDPRRGLLITAVAGPASNIALALLTGIVLRLFIPVVDDKLIQMAQNPYASFAVIFLVYSLEINLALAFFNLIPLPPLDGSRILEAQIHDPVLLHKFYRFGSIALIVMVLISITGIFPIFSLILWKPVSIFAKLFSGFSLGELNLLLHLMLKQFM